MTDATNQGAGDAAAAAAAAAAGAAQGQGAGAQGAGAANGGGANGADTPWHHGVFTDPAVRQTIHTGGYKDVNEVGKALVEAKSLIGRKGVIVPAADAPFEDRAKALREFGGVKDAAEYKVAYPEGYAPNDVDKAYEAEMRKAAFEAGVPAWAFDRMAAVHAKQIEKVGGDFKAAQAAALEAGKTEIADLEKTWGAKAPANRAIAVNAFQTLYPKDSPQAAKMEAIMGSGAMVDHFYRLGVLIGESGGTLKPGASQGFGPQSAASAQGEIDKIYAAADADNQHPYVNARHPEHKALHRRMMELQQIADPGNLNLSGKTV